MKLNRVLVFLLLLGLCGVFQNCSMLDYVGGHTCALTSTGGVSCWGANVVGQLGNDTGFDSAVPVQVQGLESGVSQIVAGAGFNCALLGTGGVKCWGSNSYGQLGDGTQVSKSLPVDVMGLSGVQSIAAGPFHVCGVTTGGGIKCWGSSPGGALGDIAPAAGSVLHEVTGLSSGVLSVVTSYGHSCALLNDGSVRCWGSNSHGQLGDGTLTDSLTPVAVAGLGTTATAVAVGDYHSCALLTGGAIRCWGANSRGQLGVSTSLDVCGTKSDTCSKAPVEPEGAGTATSIYARDYETCAIDSAGALRCWGGIPPAMPSILFFSSGVTGVSRNRGHSCVVASGNKAHCWGGNLSGELGDDSTIERAAPVEVQSGDTTFTQIVTDSDSYVSRYPFRNDIGCGP